MGLKSGVNEVLIKEDFDRIGILRPRDQIIGIQCMFGLTPIPTPGINVIDGSKSDGWALSLYFSDTHVLSVLSLDNWSNKYFRFLISYVDNDYLQP